MILVFTGAESFIIDLDVVSEVIFPGIDVEVVKDLSKPHDDRNKVVLTRHIPSRDELDELQQKWKNENRENPIILLYISRGPEFVSKSTIGNIISPHDVSARIIAFNELPMEYDEVTGLMKFTPLFEEFLNEVIVNENMIGVVREMYDDKCASIVDRLLYRDPISIFEYSRAIRILRRVNEIK